MRILSTITVFLLLLIAVPAMAVKKAKAVPTPAPIANASLFDIDETALEADFEELNKLEATVSTHGLTYSEMMNESETFKSDIPRLSNLNYNGDWRDPILNMDPFWFSTTASCLSWIVGLGCIAGPASVIYVYIDSGKDKSAGTASALGCVVGNLPAAIGYVLYVALVVSVNAS